MNDDLLLHDGLARLDVYDFGLNDLGPVPDDDTFTSCASDAACDAEGESCDDHTAGARP